MLAAVSIGFLLQLAVTQIPVLVNSFGTARLSAGEWALLLGLAAFPMIAHEILVWCEKIWLKADRHRVSGSQNGEIFPRAVLSEKSGQVD